MKNRLMVLAGIFFLVTAHADVIFTLTPGVQYGARNNEVIFTGTLSNTNLTGAVYLNDIQISLTGNATNYLAADANAFFANVPGILAPGETYSDVVFAVVISSNTPAGDYFGNVTIAGGTNLSDTTSLANQPFQVTSSDTPFGAWQGQQFGSNATNLTVSGDFADPDGDAVVNLLEYALHLDPNVPDNSGLPVPASDATCGCLSLTYTKVIGATDLVYTPEAADDLNGPWTTNGLTQAFIAANTMTLTIKASDAANPFGTATQRFMHLKVTRSP